MKQFLLTWCHKICLTMCILSASKVSSLQEETSSGRLGKAKLLEHLRSLDAFKEKLSPCGQDNIINISFNFRPNGILMVDEVEQSVTSVGHVNLFWNDPNLAWNETVYGGVSLLMLPYDQIWHPTVIVSNAAHPDFLMVDRVKTLRLSSSGSIAYVTPVFLKTICDHMDLKYYPFDVQECDILFLPFLEDGVYNISEATIGGTKTPLMVAGQWTVVSNSITVQEVEEQLDVHVIRYTMSIRRNHMYYVICVLIPMVVTSSVTSLVFWIPPSSGEKISFLVTVFVSNAVFLNFIGETMPRNMTSMPRLTLYLIMVMLQCVFSMVGTIFVIRRYEREQKETETLEEKTAILEETDKVLVTGSIEAHETRARRKSRKIRCLTDLQTVNFSEKRTEPSETSNKRKKSRPGRRICHGFCLRSTTWDMVFFIVFHLASVPCYYLLFLP